MLWPVLLATFATIWWITSMHTASCSAVTSTGCHRMQPYVSKEQYRGLNLDNTEKISSEILVFPTGNQVRYSCIKNFADIYLKFKEINQF